MNITRLVIIAALCASCAGHKVPPPPVTQRFVFVEELPDYAEVCVKTNPWVSGLSCMTLGEFRELVRGIKRASIK